MTAAPTTGPMTEEQQLQLSQIRRTQAASFGLRLMRQKLDRCDPKHRAEIESQIAAVLKAHPTLA